MGFSIVYCAGHLALAINETAGGLAVGLGLIAVGAGGIKPCVSAYMGEQFGRHTQHLLPMAFSYFYLSINVGAFASTLATPALLATAGSHVAFGLPGVLMVLATWLLWAGRGRCVHVPPRGRAALAELCSRDGLTAIGKLLALFGFVALYYSLYDQAGSAWVLQSEQMDRTFLGIEWLPSQARRNTRFGPCRSSAC